MPRSVLEKALAILSECKHIRPTIYTDDELRFVSEEDAPGVTSYREELAAIVEGYESAASNAKRSLQNLRKSAKVFKCY
jgi:hypothetical protein